jgi:hypothetical protein
MDLRNDEKLQAIAPVVSQAEEEEPRAQKRPLKNSERITGCSHRPVAVHSVLLFEMRRRPTGRAYDRRTRDRLW